MKTNLLSKYNKVCTCRMCGKRTHSSIEGNLDVELCKKCYTESCDENDHSDGHHLDKPSSRCKDCKSEGRI